MSYKKIRNNKGVSAKRSALETASVLSDALKIMETESLDGGCFLGDFADVPENGAAMSLNLLSAGKALETRKGFSFCNITEAFRRVNAKNLLFGVGAEDFICDDGVTVSLCAESETGFRFECDHSVSSALGASLGANISGKHLLRLCLGGEACPYIKIYEGDNVYFNGMPEISEGSDGRSYASAEFECESSVTLYIYYKGSGNAVYSIEGLGLISADELVDMGFDENDFECRFEAADSVVCECRVDVPAGVPEAECFANGRYIFKKGGMIVCGEPEKGKYFAESVSAPEDCRTAIYRNAGGFTVICEDHGVFVTDDGCPCVGCVEKPFRVPFAYTLYTGESGEHYGEPEEKWNMLYEYFYVKLSGLSGSVFELPSSLKVDGSYYEIVSADTLEPVSGYRIKLEPYEEGGGKITAVIISSDIYVKLRLLPASRGGGELAHMMSVYKELVFFPLGSEEHPSLQSAQNNIILFGGCNENYFAVARISEYITRDDMLIFENDEKITAILRYSEKFLLFSPHSIKKMTVVEGGTDLQSEGEAAEALFTVTLEKFKYDVGCDMPGSAVCADDKIIYANSRAGVFFVDRFGFSEKDMSRCVSANIENGENGFFACDSEDMTCAQALICDGKYFLRIGEIMYVWDFSHAVPSSSSEKESEERGMKWFIYSAEGCEKLLGADTEKLYFRDGEGGVACLCRGSGVDSDAESYFRSGEYSLSPFGKAAVWKVSVSLAAGQSCTLRLYFDGEESAERYTLTPDPEKSTLCEIRPAEKLCRRFAFSIHSFGGIRLDGARVEFLKRR